MVLQQVGILSQPFLSGVFLVAELNDDGVLEPEELGGDVVVFRNDAGVDEDDHVWSQVHQFVEKGFLKAFDSLSDCKECVGGTSRPFSGLGKCLGFSSYNSLESRKEHAKFSVFQYHRGQRTCSVTSWTCCTNILRARVGSLPSFGQSLSHVTLPRQRLARPRKPAC